ncbi:MAG: hypothetical protein HY690_09530 [Chloroflexi bacterium]|nr:hypothetical protein [Chloroflexota bacterium]
MLRKLAGVVKISGLVVAVLATVLVVAIVIGRTAAGQEAPDADPGTIKIAVPGHVRWTEDILTNTGVQVTQGQVLRITASGQWYTGSAWTGPTGRDRIEPCECPAVAPIGALIGRVAGTYFALFGPGSSPRWPSGELSATVTMPASGVLWLGMNDNRGTCLGGARDSCYRDNDGTLNVSLTSVPSPTVGPTRTSSPAPQPSRTPSPIPTPVPPPPVPPLPAPPSAVPPVPPPPPLRATLREDFDGPALDESDWLVVAGSPDVVGGALYLHQSNIESRASFQYATLRTAISSGDWKPNAGFSDSSIGFERWEGECHRGIVFKPNGILGILNPVPDDTGQCHGDPEDQVYLALPGWDDLASRTPAGEPLLLTLRWADDVVTLTVDPGNGAPIIEVSYLGAIIPHEVLNVRLNACPDVPDLVGCRDDVFLVDYLSVQPTSESL